MDVGPTRDGRRVVLATRRAVLTTWLESDAEELFRLHSDAQTMRFVRHGRPETRTEAEELLGDYLCQQADYGWAKWRVVSPDGQLIGRAGFGGTDEDRGLSYVIARPLWGQGLATEIASALVEWHLSNAAMARLHALVAVGNDATVRVLEKVGFEEAGTQQYEGVLCQRHTYPVAGGRPRDPAPESRAGAVATPGAGLNLEREDPGRARSEG